MTCQEFWNAMPELGETLEEGCEAHLNECPACAAALKNQHSLAAGLQAVRADLVRHKAPGRMEARLLAAFREQNGWMAPAKPARRRWHWAMTWASAAAVVAVAFLVFAGHGRQPAPPVKQAPASEANAIDWTAELPAGASQTEATGQFIPVPNADRLPQTTDLNLVRVEVPRSAMIALGYSVSAERAQERVRADVVMGADGLARAVRFLDE